MNRRDKALLKTARPVKAQQSKTATEILLKQKSVEKGYYVNAIIPYRLSIQSMLENPIVKDVRARLFGGGV